MKWVIATLCLFFLAAGPAHANCTAPCTKSQVTTDINANWPDNTTGLITPSALRSTVLDLVNSYYDTNGVPSAACAAHQWVAALPSLSSIQCTQPAFSDLTGSISPSQCPISTTLLNGCSHPDGTTITIDGGGSMTAIGSASTSIDAGGATSITNGKARDYLFQNGTKLGHTGQPYALFSTMAGAL